MTHKVEEPLEKILAVFVWQQPVEEPQGHANERWAFQKRGGESGCCLLTDSRPQRGRGSLRGQGSELSRDPTTTNAARSSKLLHHQRGELVKWPSSQPASQPAHTQQRQLCITGHNPFNPEYELSGCLEKMFEIFTYEEKYLHK